jgi:ATP-dependent Clp protease ATP-binding subunit ClpC
MQNFFDMVFTERARHLFVLANEHAVRLRHHHFGAEHILLGILDLSGGGARMALDSMQIDRSLVRTRLEGIVPMGSAPPHRGERPYAKYGVSALQGAMAQAPKSGGAVVTTGHLLLGVLTNQIDPSCQALDLAGVSISNLAAAALENLQDDESGA